MLNWIVSIKLQYLKPFNCVKTNNENQIELLEQVGNI